MTDRDRAGGQPEEVPPADRRRMYLGWILRVAAAICWIWAVSLGVLLLAVSVQLWSSPDVVWINVALAVVLFVVLPAVGGTLFWRVAVRIGGRWRR